MIKKKKYKVEFAKQDKVDESAYQLIEDLFGIKGAFLSDESILDDFDTDIYSPFSKSELKIVNEASRRIHLKRIEKIYGISLKEYPDNEPLYIWKVARYIAKNLENRSEKTGN